MDLEDVRIFTKVAELGSFTKAADFLDLPKSTVSRRVSELEDSLNVRLIQRTTRKLSLTYAGELYFARTSRLIAELDEAELAVQELQRRSAGAAAHHDSTRSEWHDDTPLCAFQEKYPLVELAVMSTGRRVDLIAEGYDLAIRAGQLDDSSLVSRKLFEVPFALFASCDYLKRHGRPKTPQDLTQHSCLVFSGEKTNATWTLNGPNGEVHVDVHGPIASNDLRLVQTLTRDGRGIGFLPQLWNDETAHTIGLERVLDGLCRASQRTLRRLPELTTSQSTSQSFHRLFGDPTDVVGGHGLRLIFLCLQATFSRNRTRRRLGVWHCLCSSSVAPDFQ